MPLGSMLEGLYIVQDKYPDKVDRRALEDSSLSIYVIRLNAWGVVHHPR